MDNNKDQRKGITIRVEPEYHIKLKTYASSKGISIQDYIKSLVDQDLKKNGVKI